MRITDFVRNRAFAILAASLAAVAIFILIAKPRGGGIAEPHSAAAPAPAPASSAGSAPGPIPPPSLEAILEPQTAPRPPAREDLSTAFPPSRLPDVATVQGATFSLACLARNGADLSKPMPSKHCVFAANDEVAARLQAWAKANGFEVRDAEALHGHTGTTEYRFNLVRVEVPVPENIEREGRMILAAVQQIPGTYYQTWSGEIVH
jgi:hypothetical protein